MKLVLLALSLGLAGAGYSATFVDDAAKIHAILDNNEVAQRFADHQGIDAVTKTNDSVFRLRNGRCSLEVDLQTDGNSVEVTKVGKWVCGG